MGMLCKGRMTKDDLNRLYEDRVEEGAILCTDSHKSYIGFAKDLGLDHKRVPTGKHMVGIYHIQHINSLHSHLKSFVDGFKGVSTKYLGNYLYWFKWLQYFKEEKEILKGKNLLLNGATSVIQLKIEDYKTRKPLFV